MISCLIIETNKASIELLSNYIEKTSGLHLLGKENCPLNTLNLTPSKNIDPDITCGCIAIKKIPGIEPADDLATICNPIHPNTSTVYEVTAFDKEDLDFLIKPLTNENFIPPVEKPILIDHPNEEFIIYNESTYFYVKNGKKGSYKRIQVENILFVEAADHYSTIHFRTQEKYTIYAPLGEIMHRLPKSNFMRVHKSYIVNLNTITDFEGNLIYLENNKAPIPIGLQYKDAFTEVIMKNLL